MMRAFTDSTGLEWRVWEVLPSKLGPQTITHSLTHAKLQAAYADGWLCFEAGEQKRRLAPIPEGWQFRDTSVLEQLCVEATPVPPRRTTTGATVVAPPQTARTT
jgi:hypothetical protein